MLLILKELLENVNFTPNVLSADELKTRISAGFTPESGILSWPPLCMLQDTLYCVSINCYILSFAAAEFKAIYEFSKKEYVYVLFNEESTYFSGEEFTTGKLQRYSMIGRACKVGVAT